MRKNEIDSLNLRRVYPELSRGAALIIAILIIAIVGGVLLAVGRDIISSSFSSNRYSDSLVATELAWAGIEDGLTRFRLGTETGTQYYPNFSGSVATLDDIKALYNKVIRRNVSEPTTGKDEIAGNIFPFTCSPPCCGAIGLRNDTPLTESCKDATCGNFTDCTASKWDQSDDYYQFRVSGSDDDLGPVLSASLAPQTNKLVNLDQNYQVVMKSGYYRVAKSEPYVPDPSGGSYNYVDRVFDLTNYKGNITTGGGYAPREDQRIVMEISVDNINPGEKIMANSVVYYPDPDPSTSVNESLACYTSFPAQEWVAENNFYANTHPWEIGNSTTLTIPIPRPCKSGDAANTPTGDFAGNVKYLAIRFRLWPFATTSGCANCSVSFGLRTSANPTAGTPWWPKPDSFIGTGITKIISTGIYNNVRETVEIWAAKDIYSSFQDIATGEHRYLHCRGVPAPNDTSTGLSDCNIRIYRQIVY